MLQGWLFRVYFIYFFECYDDIGAWEQWCQGLGTMTYGLEWQSQAWEWRHYDLGTMTLQPRSDNVGLGTGDTMQSECEKEMQVCDCIWFSHSVFIDFEIGVGTC